MTLYRPISESATVLTFPRESKNELNIDGAAVVCDGTRFRDSAEADGLASSEAGLLRSIGGSIPPCPSTVRVLTRRFGGLLGPEYLIGYGDRYFRCGELSLSQLKRGVSPDELFMLEVDPAASDDEIWGE